jgi:hypothetical protein
MDIVNRVRVVKRPDGSQFKLSEYRYTAPVGQLALL